jgi:superfamily II DNA or RNA helicase
VQLRREDLSVYLMRSTPAERKWIHKYLTFKTSSFVRVRGRAKHIMKAMHLFEVEDDRFPAGLLPLVLKRARELGHTVSVLDGRSAPLPVDPEADLSWLRDYQRKALDAAVRRERGILWMPTGAGKTEVVIGLTRARPGPWMFVVHRKELMHQAAERLLLRWREHAPADLEARERLGELVVGMCGDGRYDVLGQDGEGPQFVVSTFQSLAKANGPTVRNFARARGVIIDECHTLPADTFYKTIMRFENARYRIGVSGTPLARGDKKSIFAIACLGPVVYRIKSEFLIETGVLAKPKIRMVPVVQDITAPTWQGAYGAGIVRSTVRNKAVTKIAKIAKKPALVFVKEIKHGKALLKRLHNAKTNAEFIWGTDSTARRKAAIARLQGGDIDILICSVVFQEGVDIPDLRSVVIACGGKSVIASLQRIGRGMRRAEGKTTFEVWDILDRGNKWLEAHAKKRSKAYMKEGHNVTIEKGIPLV